MRKRLAAILGLAGAVVAIGAQSATAATEVGNKCVASTSAGGFTYITLASAPGSPIPATVPGAGVITRWSFSVIPLPPESVITETLKVFRPTGVPNQFQVIGESLPELQLGGGTKTFPTRIPVEAGDHIGAVAAAGGSTGSVFCDTKAVGDRVGAIAPGTALMGSTETLSKVEEGRQNPVVVFVEPDADNDGFGDETQDQCPRNAATQAPCPLPPPPPAPASLSGSSVVKKNFLTVLITSSSQVPVTVAGTAKLGKRKTARLNGGTQLVAPGVLARFVIPIPKAIKNKLKQLSRKRTLVVNLTATAANPSGTPTVTTLKAKLKGQAKPKPKRPKAKRG